MAWTDRIKPAAYVSPSGRRITFTYEDVSKAFGKKTTGFNFPDAEGTYVQDLGNTGRRYPLRIIFWGTDYDLDANNFEELLLERGTGRLEHPIYGTIDVIPFGAITRRDNLKTAGNQAIFEVTFWETTGLIYPTPQRDPGNAVLSSIDAYNSIAADEFEEVTSLDSAVEQVAIRNDYERLLANAREGLGSIANTQDSVRQRFENIESSISLGIDTLISEPITLAFQTILLIQTPANIVDSAVQRLEAYAGLARSLLTDGDAAVEPGFDARNSNRFHVSNLYASTYVTGAVLSVVNTSFDTKDEAVIAAENLLNLLGEVVEWRDSNFESLGEIDTGSSYQQLQEAVALAAGFLVAISFTLRQERRVILDRPRTIIDLAAELYGSVDDQLDFLISSNNLSGSDILELPKGREIVYYV